MKKLLLLLPLLIFCFTLKKGEVTSPLPAISKVKNLYFDPKNSTFLSTISLDEAINPSDLRKIQTKRRRFDLRFKKTVEKTAVFLLEKQGTSHHLSHFFHFLEHLIPIYHGIDSKTEDPLFILVGNGEKKKKTDWLGKNETTKHLILSLFPKAQIYHPKDLIQNEGKKLLHFKKAIISDRSLEDLLEEPFHTERYLGRYLASLDPSVFTRLREKVHAYVKFKPQLKDKFHVTYVLRDRVRILNPEKEKKLLDQIRKIEGVDLQVVDFAKMSFADQVQTVANTDCLLGVHGNGFCHTLFLPEKACLIELFPKNTFRMEYPLFAHFAGVEYYGYEKNSGWIKDYRRDVFGNTVEVAVESIDIEGICQIIREKSGR